MLILDNSMFCEWVLDDNDMTSTGKNNSGAMSCERLVPVSSLPLVSSSRLTSPEVLVLVEILSIFWRAGATQLNVAFIGDYVHEKKMFTMLNLNRDPNVQFELVAVMTYRSNSVVVLWCWRCASLACDVRAACQDRY